MVTLAKLGQIVGGKQAIVINKPGAPGQTISMPGSQKTVTLSPSGGNKGGGQIDQTSSSQIIQLPVDGLMSGGKPVTVQMAGGGQKTLTLVQAPQNIHTTKVQQTASLTGNFIRFAKLLTAPW